MATRNVDNGKSVKTPTSIFAKRLREMRSRWNESKDKGAGGNVSDGKKTARLSNAELKEGNGKLGAVFDFTIFGPEDEKGEKVSRWAGFDTDERMVYLQKDLRRLGVEVDDLDIEELPGILAQLTKDKPAVRLSCKTNGDYFNVYIDKVIDLEDEDEVEGTAEEEAEDDEEGGSDTPTKEDDDDEEEEEKPSKGKKGKAKPKDEEEDEEDESEEEDEEEASVEIEVGDEVSYKSGGKKQTGVVTQVRKDGTSQVKNDVTKKIDRISIKVLEKLATVEDE